MSLPHHAFRAAMWLAYHPGNEDIPAKICPPGQLGDVASELQRDGWTVPAETKMLAQTRFTLDRGKADLLKSNKQLRKYRKDELAVRLLEWIADNPDAHTSVGNLADIPELAEDFTGDFTKDEFERVGDRLHEDGLIKGFPTSGGLIRPTITSRGEQVLESDYAPNNTPISVAAQGAGPSVSYSNTFNGAVGGFSQGDHNTLNITQQNLNPAAENALEQLKGQVPADDTEAQALVEQIEVTARSEKRSEAVITALVTALASKVGGGVGEAILSHGQQLVSALPF